jgi:hypothetical protein
MTSARRSTSWTDKKRISWRVKRGTGIAAGGIEGNHARPLGLDQDSTEDAIGVSNLSWSDAVSNEVTHPALDVNPPNVDKSPGPKGRKYVTAKQHLVARSGRWPEVHSGLEPVVGKVREGNLSEAGVGPRSVIKIREHVTQRVPGLGHVSLRLGALLTAEVAIANLDLASMPPHPFGDGRCGVSVPTPERDLRSSRFGLRREQH